MKQICENCARGKKIDSCNAVICNKNGMVFTKQFTCSDYLPEGRPVDELDSINGFMKKTGMK